jgi:hypothetical protein
MGPVLICSYSEGGHDVVIQVAHIHIRVGVEWRRSGSRQGQMEVEGGRGFPGGGQRGEEKKEGKREVIP